MIEERTRQMQKMEAMGELTGGIAHDFNNLLTIISANAELIEQDLPDTLASLRSELAELKAAARRGSAMVRKLLTFSRETEIELKPVEVGALVSEITGMLRRLLPENIEIRGDVAPELTTIMGDPGAIEQALINLGTNARDAMPNGGRLELTVRRMALDDSYLTAVGASVEPGNYACISVTDNGSGMDERTRQKIFEPFFTTKPPNQGTGLGMAMVYGIVRHHSGFINVYSEVGKGTTIRVFFPLAPSAVREVKPDPGPAPRGGSETVLVVEDEDMIRSSARRILERFGYTVLVAADGEEALGILRSSDHEVRLVISDVVMPRLSGRQLHDAVIREKMPVRFMYTSGYTALDARETATLDPGVPFLPKPWVVADLLNRIRSVLDAR
jgi:CheY-like chemotaxis protein